MGGDRFSFRSALAGGLIAAMVMTAMPVIASVGDAIRAGQTTGAGERTVLRGNVDSQNLMVKNTGDGEAARFVTGTGVAPFQVNRTKKVKNLNADRVDGLSVRQIAPRAAFNSVDNAPNGADYTLSTEITAPAPGILLIEGGIEALVETGFDGYNCGLEVDDSHVTGSLMWSLMAADTSPLNNEEDCSTSGAVSVNAGTYTVDLEVADVGLQTSLEYASVWVLWVPFDGAGQTPSATAGLTDTTPARILPG